jgi:hypothetical protein
MLAPEVSERMTIESALNHNWILGQQLEDEEEAKEIIVRTRRHKRTHSRTLHTRGEGKTDSKGLWHKYFGKTKDGKLIRLNDLDSDSNLPVIMTKVPSQMKDFQILEYNLVLSKRFGGKIPTYLLPIGHTKEQKHGTHKIKDYLDKRFSTIEHKPLDLLSKAPRTKSAVSRFKTQDKEASLVQNKSKGKLIQDNNATIGNATNIGGSSHRGPPISQKKM